MDIGHLNYFMEKVLKQKYPWIEGHQWTSWLSSEDGYRYYKLYIFPNEEYSKKRYLFDRLEEEIWKEIIPYFNLMREDRFEEFYWVMIVKDD